MDSKLYVAIVKGFYRHEVLGVFNSAELAEQVAKLFFKIEKDCYHDIEIVICTLNKFPTFNLSDPFKITEEKDSYTLRPEDLS